MKEWCCTSRGSILSSGRSPDEDSVAERSRWSAWSRTWEVSCGPPDEEPAPGDRFFQAFVHLRWHDNDDNRRLQLEVSERTRWDQMVRSVRRRSCRWNGFGCSTLLRRGLAGNCGCPQVRQLKPTPAWLKAQKPRWPRLLRRLRRPALCQAGSWIVRFCGGAAAAKTRLLPHLPAQRKPTARANERTHGCALPFGGSVWTRGGARIRLRSTAGRREFPIRMR